jgi:hypothetical protein
MIFINQVVKIGVPYVYAIRVHGYLICHGYKVVGFLVIP